MSRVVGAVHPRERGERRRAPTTALVFSRFIPASAGNAGRHDLGGVRERFIPASAGNATTSTSGRWRSTVHPRERGERVTDGLTVAPYSGSSPRARGTRCRQRRLARAHRFIPASAGNARARCRPAASRAVHPRERGERACRWPPLGALSGSSRERGERGCGGFLWPRYAVHPRERGERCAWMRRPPPLLRFIPASAGNAPQPGTDRPAPAVHPRERGERQHHAASIFFASGSSPRARGTHRD